MFYKIVSSSGHITKGYLTYNIVELLVKILKYSLELKTGTQIVFILLWYWRGKLGGFLYHRTHYSILERILTFQWSSLYNYGFFKFSISVSRLLTILQRINFHLILFFKWPPILCLWVFVCLKAFFADF